MRRRLDDVPVEEIAPFVPFEEMLCRMAWKHSESVTLIGPPDRGKSTLAIELLKQRRNVVALITKPKDNELKRNLERNGYREFVHGIPSPLVARRVTLWPKAATLTDTVRQAALVRQYLEQVWREGDRALYLDEVHYLAEMLHLARLIKMLETQGRTNGISVVAGFQRPAWVPRDVYSSAKHLFIFGTNDEVDIKALGGIGGMSSMKIRRVVEHLGTDAADPHDFLYAGTRTGTLLRSRLILPK